MGIEGSMVGIGTSGKARGSSVGSKAFPENVCNYVGLVWPVGKFPLMIQLSSV